MMDKQLVSSKRIAGSQYAIADIAIFPWLRCRRNQGIDSANFPHFKNWFDVRRERPACSAG